MPSHKNPYLSFLDEKKSSSKFVFISGGVLSGLGKGLCAASLGLLLKQRDYKISTLKCENYLNIDAGTINPIEHGDPFLTDDGLEADMDLGTYERILNQNMGKANFVTKGQIFNEIIKKERAMFYEGETVEDVPHIVSHIIEKYYLAAEGSDICIIEIGGTVGEYQNVLYYEAARFLREMFPGSVVNAHVSYLPVPSHLGEPKTKPTQMSVRAMMAMGINPEFLILRSNVDLDQRRRYLLGIKSGVPEENVIMAKDLDNIYELPLHFQKQNFDKKVLKVFNLREKKLNMSEWNKLIANMKSKKHKSISIAIVGKYLAKNEGDYELDDAYHALIEALRHAGWYTKTDVDIKMIKSNDPETKLKKSLKQVDAIIVPIGWGKRGVNGKLFAIKYARENKVPYVGLCYGMQLACIEYARNVLKISDADTEENSSTSKNKIIHRIPFNKKYQVIKGKGTSMRLGAQDCVIKPKTLAYRIYSKHGAFKDKRKKLISERHRHRFEFNNEYREKFEKNLFVFSGTSPDNFFVEYIELPQSEHPFFIATQAHPEYKSKPINPHPLFIELIKAAYKYK